ncbi:MAG: lamin tail domain-containing protein, partial [Ekhidna sp.]|nr:lamin tail domain-containing protein [Ekhidna sp.]
MTFNLKKRPFAIIFLIIICQHAVGQVTDSFDDGDFTANPIWSGDDSEFTVDGLNQLRLNNAIPASNNESYLSLSSEAINDAIWEFKVGFEGLSSGGLSGSNQMFIYLVSDIADLEGSVNGYYVRIGGSADDISLFKTSSTTPLVDGTDDVTQTSSAFISVKVTRDNTGNWELLIDESGTNTFSSEGVAFDNQFVTSSFFGILCDYTSTRSTNFFFDDIDVTGTGFVDNISPTIETVTAISQTEVEVNFSENVEETTAETTANYTLDGSIAIASAQRDDTDLSLVHLTISALTNGTTYTITVNDVKDENSNPIAANSQASFQYLVFEEASDFDVVVNEFMPDPNPVKGLPDAEFVELYNRSGKYFNLENWTLDGQALAAFTIAPDSYVIVVEDDDESLFSSFTNVLIITTLSLNNSNEDNIVLKDDNGDTVHSIAFEGSTGGTSTESINPNGPDYSEN